MPRTALIVLAVGPRTLLGKADNQPERIEAMARYTGAVRFPDGELRYFVWQGTTDIARPKLFASPEQADDAWDDDQYDVPRHEKQFADESIEVMPYFCHGRADVQFLSTGNRSLQLITGPLSFDETTSD